MGEVLQFRDYQPKTVKVDFTELAEASQMLQAAITSMTLSLTNLNEPITFASDLRTYSALKADEPPTEST